MMATDMTCRELVGWVTSYLDGAMPVWQRARLAAHLAYCGSCKRYIRQMRQTISALRKLAR